MNKYKEKYISFPDSQCAFLCIITERWIIKWSHTMIQSMQVLVISCWYFNSWSMSVVWYFNGTYYDNLLKLLCIPVLRGGVPHIGIDHQWLTINFELKFFVSTCFHMIWGFQKYQKPCLSQTVCPYPGPEEKKSAWLRQYQSYSYISNSYIIL